MNNRDFVYNQIYKGALKQKATERAAHQAALTGSEDYRKGRFKNATILITDKIKEAKKVR